MNIEDLTIGQARKIAHMLTCNTESKTDIEADIASHFIGKYCIVRTYSAGVHSGVVEARSGKEITLKDSRRIWHWKGAASLSQLAQSGTGKPDQCKFSVQIETILLTEAIEVIRCTPDAEKSIRGVFEWKA